jgi:hypothetical protein
VCSSSSSSNPFPSRSKKPLKNSLTLWEGKKGRGGGKAMFIVGAIFYIGVCEREAAAAYI